VINDAVVGDDRDAVGLAVAQIVIISRFRITSGCFEGDVFINNCLPVRCFEDSDIYPDLAISE
jgi:hypothetical protein